MASPSQWGLWLQECACVHLGVAVGSESCEQLSSFLRLCGAAGGQQLPYCFTQRLAASGSGAREYFYGLLGFFFGESLLCSLRVLPWELARVWTRSRVHGEDFVRAAGRTDPRDCSS